ncbi:MAG: TetR/AcrR family transcriptional regulator [Pseudomonadota bacterium]
MEKPVYHHGDLRAALLDAAEAELLADPRCTLSVRALAAEIGVSATAPHAHFKTKADLLAALAVRGFERLRDETIARSARTSGVEQRFAALAEAYLRFSEAYPGLYRIMFLIGADFNAYPELRRASLASFHVLEDAIREYELAAPQDDALDLAFAAWALVHGMASLLSDDRVTPEVARSQEVPDLARIAARLITSRHR